MDSYEVTLEFLSQLMSFFTQILAYQVFAGISLGTILLYNFLLVAIFTVLARRS